ncbi:OmpA family protein [Aliikangiella marina]|uniref:OmpA family protein n=1 Tax=Aliikangiella marina TaxID=1712262 RepID=A0A545T9S6_9GAMM|nr:OmpA family protein [Aliikangiella marina]TQV73958.1 OmpA family protein [Aliikangiella marina]
MNYAKITYLVCFMLMSFTIKANSWNCHASMFVLDCFRSHKTELLEIHLQQLNEVAIAIKRQIDNPGTYYPIDHVSVIGHSAMFNANLPNAEKALERANNVKTELQKALRRHDVNNVKVTVGGMSVNEPIIDNRNQHNRSLNRRVEIFPRSLAVFRKGNKGLKLYSNQLYRNTETLVIKGATCRSDYNARQVCLERMSFQPGELIGAICLPLKTHCIIGRGRK